MQLTAHTRQSAKFRGLTYDLAPTGRPSGSWYVEFKFGGIFEAYELFPGEAAMVDCSDRGNFPRDVSSHCRAIAKKLAALVPASQAA